jgi:hypothetical protein
MFVSRQGNAALYAEFLFTRPSCNMLLTVCRTRNRGRKRWPCRCYRQCAAPSLVCCGGRGALSAVARVAALVPRQLNTAAAVAAVPAATQPVGPAAFAAGAQLAARKRCRLVVGAVTLTYPWLAGRLRGSRVLQRYDPSIA